MYNQDILYTNSLEPDLNTILNNGIINNNNINKNRLYTEQLNIRNKMNYIKNNLNKNIPNNIYNNVKNIRNNNDLLNTNTYDSNKKLLDNTPKNNNEIFKNIDKLKKEKYEKIRQTDISIYSEDRNLELSILPNNFDIELNKTYKNIKKIILKDIYFPNSIPILTNNNNRFSWMYPKLEDANTIFIPDPNSNTPYILSDYSNLLNTTTNSNQLIYSTKLNIKYANTDEFEKQFTNQLQNNYHYIKNLNDLSNINADSNNYRLETEFKNIDLSGHCINFDLDIDTNNHIVKMVNRIEKLQIYSYQITKNTSSNSDIFYNYILSSTNPLQKDRIYITIKEDDYNDISMNDMSNNNLFPLVITNFKDIGNINSNLVNYTPFYDNSIYSTTPINISTFKYFDTLTFTDSDGNSNNLVRLELLLS